eukprot:CAMPEP_0118697336 /NCGR_PEP_ID=MMETSP0800-20121206/14430_1 /TAXON_ID=210618 ORGANISM="Striatella unipunctata, Strain CCMP2910" /NCGR_SAMPLE_ID=MMETSP0800 /ASSEMBLY_ACC=CAM_ASM_000638 /LENGTH=647 /DNA_ID=CAMNT_0006596717 /DNA_START=42 /DNA_END=1985 /DNA_ORIENTATION=+
MVEKSKKSKSNGSKKRKAGVRKPLREIVQDRILNDILGSSAAKWPGWMIMVLDKGATRVAANAVGMYDLMEQRVSLVEDLYKKRAPFPDMAAVYVLAAKDDSVKRVMMDFLPTETREKPLYGGAFLYFLGKVSDKLVQKIKACKPLLKHVKALSEVNIDFLTKESNVFHLDMRRCFAPVYKQPGASGVEKKIAQKLVTVCATLNEYPHIRFRANSQVCGALAKAFHSQMNEFVGTNSSWWYHGDSKNTKTERATLILLDRSDDCLTPLMHEFTYQAMVNDLLPIRDDRITYKSDTINPDDGKAMEKEVLLNDNDNVWVELRGKHIADVIQTLSNRIRDMVESNTTAAVSKNSKQPLSLAQMASALKELPEYREIMSKLSQHMHISHQCMDLFNRRGLLEVSELEQTLATGQTEDGRTPKLSEIINSMEETLSKTKDVVSRIRLLAIMIISQKGIREADRERLFEAARLSSRDMKVINNLEKLGIPLVSESTKSTVGSLFGGTKVENSGNVDAESEYASSRYKNPMKTILTELSEGQLSIEEYPSVLPMPQVGGGGGTQVTSARNRPVAGSVRSKESAQNRWNKQSETVKKPATYSGGRQLVFVVGGISFAEIRVVREVADSARKEIIVGATALIKPGEFVEDLASLT